MSEEPTPDAVWEQDVPNGGASGGELPTRAVATVPVGIVTTREVPPLKATFGLLPISAGGAQRLGREPRRRRLLVSVQANTGTPTSYVVIAENQQQAAAGYGLPVLQGAPTVTIHYAGELWFAAFGADARVGFIAEIDEE